MGKNKKDNKKKMDGGLNPKTTHFEFMGPIGAFFMSSLSSDKKEEKRRNSSPQ
jgi:hypothetical protein